MCAILLVLLDLVTGISKELSWGKSPGDTQAHAKLQTAVNNMRIPTGLGRSLGNKVGFKFAGFTAEQWRTFVTLCAPVVLKPALDAHDKANGTSLFEVSHLTHHCLCVCCFSFS